MYIKLKNSQVIECQKWSKEHNIGKLSHFYPGEISIGMPHRYIRLYVEDKDDFIIAAMKWY